MRLFHSLLFFFTPCVFSHPHHGLTDEQVAMARTIFQQFKADPTNPQAIINNPGLFESLKAIFGGIFGDEELKQLFLDIFYDDHEEDNGEHGATIDQDGIEDEGTTIDADGDDDADGDGETEVDMDDQDDDEDVGTDDQDEVEDETGAKVDADDQDDDEEDGGTEVDADDHKGSNVEKGGEGNTPSILLSDYPSSMPSDVPSSIPSDLPSSMPSDVPSQTPIEWVDSTDPSIKATPKDFATCPTQDGIPASLEKSPKLSIMYGYRLELTEDANMAEVMAAVEDKVTNHLLSSVCGAEKALAVSSGPTDIPGAWCEPDAVSGLGSCLYIAGRTTLLVSNDVAKDSAPLYCTGLESIRELFDASGDFAAIDGIVSISSTVGVDSLVPDYCQTTSTGGGATMDETSSSSLVNNGSRTDNTPSTYNGGLRWTGFTVMAIAVFALLLFAAIIVMHRGRLARRRPRPMRMMQSRSRMDLDQYNLSPRADEDGASSFSDVWQAEESSTVIAVMPAAK